jgi:hypothetical protein
MMLPLKARKGLLLTALCLIHLLSFCQDTLSRAPISFGARFNKGFFLTNKPKAVLLRNAWSYSGEISVDIQTDGKAYWQRANRYPKVGVAAFFGSTGSAGYLGNMAGVFPYINFPLARYHGFSARFRLGTGLAWVQKPFDVHENPRNLMIGSHVNSCISMLLDLEFQLTRHFSISEGISFTHISNGLWQLPNLGLNIPAVSLGVRYKLAEPAEYKKPVSPTWDRGPHWQVFLSGAVKQGNWIESPHYLVTMVNAELMYTKKHGHELGFGILFTVDPSLSAEESNEPVLSFDNSQPKIQAGIYGAYEHNIGRVSIPLQMGAYFYNKYSINRLFQVIGLRYAINKNWKALFQLKTHLGKADHIDWGIGYRFK